MNNNVLILGANSDIAKALAVKFAEQGYNLQLAARNTANLDKVKTDLQLRFNITVNLYHYDATDFNAIPQFFNQLPIQPTIVIMAVGLFYAQNEIEFDNITDSEKAKLLTITNFTGPALILEHAAQMLSKNNNPTTIIAISSVAGDRGRAKNYWYGAAKSALNEFLSGLRQKYVHSNLLIMTVKPGFVATKMIKHKLSSPGFLTASADEAATWIFSSMKKRKTVVYPWKWWFIMTIIKLLPERLFIKLKF